jgi:hypothetical protein
MMLCARGCSEVVHKDAGIGSNGAKEGGVMRRELDAVSARMGGYGGD